MLRFLWSALLVPALMVSACHDPAGCPSGMVQRGNSCKPCPAGTEANNDECVAPDGGRADAQSAYDAQADAERAAQDAASAASDAASADGSSADAQGPGSSDANSLPEAGLDAGGDGSAQTDASDGAAADAPVASPDAHADASPSDATLGDAAEAATPMGDDLVRLLAPSAWLRADSVVTSNNKVSSLRDKIDGAHLVTQPDGALQVATPAPLAAFNSQPVLTFLGQQWYGSSWPAAAWSFLHNGQGAEVFHVFAPTSLAGFQCIVATGSGSSPSTTSTTYLSGSGLSKTIRNGAQTVIQGTAGDLALNVPVQVHESFATGSTPDFSLRFTGGTAYTADVQSAPTSDQAGSLRLSGCTDGVYNASMQWAESIFFSRVLTASERQSVKAYVTARYGAAIAGQ